MQTLFTANEERRVNANAPLAVRVRPKTLDEYCGQDSAVGPGTWLRRAIEHDTLSSVILFGPAGTGKTTLARIIAHTTRAEFVEVSAVTGTVKDLREQIDAAGAPSCSLMRFTASTAASKMPCSTPWRTASSCLWVPPRRTRSSK